ncbi:phosphatase [Enemella dayhoffiae]|uniref:Phosphatase n=2 Tax=Enemella dayhoffiae TaxID=2016507 RepID=A0A255HFV8_9ACTN|nr:phosphatase [Enemella dayhoffiae]
MDGTLVDSTAAIVRSWTSWAIEFEITEQQLQGFHGVPSGDVVRQLVPAARAQAAIERINALELDDVTDVVPLPGAVAALADVPAERAAIATSCSAPLARARLAAAGIEAPAVLVTVDDVSRGKPAPDPFLKAAERLGVDPADCLVVEDAPKGLQAAAAAGCARLAVVTTTPATELVADAVVANLAAVRFQAAGDRVRLLPAG